MTANLRLIAGCAPLLRAAEAGRAVFITSRHARTPGAYWAAYGATKAALEHLALSWADEVASTRLRVNLFDAGVVATRLRAAAMPGEDPRSIAQPADVAPAIAALCDAGETRHGQIIGANLLVRA
jgi:NAD(P)-dependent dehydrogenase (short-subunit alcohol dehydrogenase family)